jgi:hypothetical protein
LSTFFDTIKFCTYERSLIFEQASNVFFKDRRQGGEDGQRHQEVRQRRLRLQVPPAQPVLLNNRFFFSLSAGKVFLPVLRQSVCLRHFAYFFQLTLIIIIVSFFKLLSLPIVNFPLFAPPDRDVYGRWPFENICKIITSVPETSRRFFCVIFSRILVPFFQLRCVRRARPVGSESDG